LNIAAVDGIGSFKYDIAKIGNQLQISMTTEIIKSNRLGGLLPSFERVLSNNARQTKRKIILTKV
jgi:hypothetical protein